MNLAEYERAKFELAEIARALQAAHLQPTAADTARIAELFVRLAEDRFNLVVIGRFSRGKSSLMNAVLGAASLPVGIVPLTSVITTVAYGSSPSATIHYRDRLFAEPIDLEALPQYVTEKGNPANVRGVRVAEVRLPAEILRRGFHFVDTPGLGSTIAENTRATEAFLPQADAFILVTSYEGALSENEMELLRVAVSSSRRVFLAVNKHDLVTPVERQEALRDVEARLAALPGADRVSVFSVSARDALEAKRCGDKPGIEASGVARLEGELVRYLVAEKSRDFLLRLCRRSADLAAELLPDAAASELAQRTRALAERLGSDEDAGCAEAGDARAAPSLSELPACEVCERVARAVFDFLCGFQYRLSVQREEQRAHAQRGGLCALHTWQYASLTSTQAIATGYPLLLERLSAWFRRNADSRATPAVLAGRIRAILPGARSCPLCQVRAQAEAAALLSVASRFSRDAAAALDSLSALCLLHLPQVIASLEDALAAEDLMLREAVILQRLAEDMRRYATKHDAVRRTLASDEETRAARTAMVVLAGLRNVNASVAFEYVEDVPSEAR